ncbi:thermonuclease family protein [Aspergillus chevalieri]|uniref:Probable endonuclease LCL3 n=1 Tax=Aspergillus chevalieri TaxID=182096 RepID=A0A7R7VGJ8_ASPCH|nr:putative endonuclease lcl3 [Aspergillus chevalieri]BCR84328.1 putative endonuclease lcl3 [Aspergillus chevalieri]
MRWPWSSDKSHPNPDNDQQQQEHYFPTLWSSSSSPSPSKPRDWNTSLNATDWAAFTETRTLVPTLILTGSILALVRIHRRYFRRFSDATKISPWFFRRRSIYGQVTSVGDGDNFRLYHTPGGKLTGWGWLPWKKVPTLKRELRDKTVHVRLAGIDAPELSHFGRPEQPFARDAHTWLTSYLLHRNVHAYVHRQDQYQRVVASVYVRRALDFPIPFRRRDVSYEMLKRGLATVYEAKFGAEFGGEAMENKYRKAEWWAKWKKKGLWVDFSADGKDWESPRDYKTRMGGAKVTHEKEKENGKGKANKGK